MFKTKDRELLKREIVEHFKKHRDPFASILSVDLSPSCAFVNVQISTGLKVKYSCALTPTQKIKKNSWKIENLIRK